MKIIALFQNNFFQIRITDSCKQKRKRRSSLATITQSLHKNSLNIEFFFYKKVEYSSRICKCLVLTRHLENDFLYALLLRNCLSIFLSLILLFFKKCIFERGLNLSLILLFQASLPGEYSNGNFLRFFARSLFLVNKKTTLIPKTNEDYKKINKNELGYNMKKGEVIFHGVSGSWCFETASQ